jgi:hypothetical protein
LTVDADHPIARAWVGVSAADAQSYVPDEIPGGGRPGNESRIAVAVAQARYLGRPAFVVPLLPPVPETRTDEPTGSVVRFGLDLRALFAAAAPPIAPGTPVRVERINLDALLARLASTAGRFVFTQPDGTKLTYQLAGADKTNLETQIASGIPGNVDSRYLLDLIERAGSGIETLWAAAVLRADDVTGAPPPDPAVPFGPVVDSLPPKPERWIYRVRIADAAGHVSATGAVIPWVVRVPSLRAPASPHLYMDDSSTGDLSVAVTYVDGFDVRWLVLFAKDEASLAPLTSGGLVRPALLRQPNLGAAYPDEGIQLRLADGTLLAPAAKVGLKPGPFDGPERSLSVNLSPGPGRRLYVWGVVLTIDGVPSRLAGPCAARTGGA